MNGRLCTGLKSLFDFGKAPPLFFAAACELGLGFIPVLGEWCTASMLVCCAAPRAYT